MRESIKRGLSPAVLTILAILTLTGGAAMGQLATISGTASYRERVALKPGAVLEIELLDVSRQDVPAQRLASIRIRPSGQVPIPFTLSYDPAMIEAHHTYAVTAKIIRNGATIFRSDTIHPVLTRGAGDTVDVSMVSIGGPTTDRRSTRGGPHNAGLIGPTWVAEDIAGKGVIDNLQSTITFAADGTVQGNGGCNRFHGRYTGEGQKLTLGQLARTSRACLPAIGEQDQRFYQALDKTRGYRIEKGLLVLLDSHDQPTMRLWKRD